MMEEEDISHNSVRLLNFSDGTLESPIAVIDTDVASGGTEKVVAPSQLEWLPWAWYQTARAGQKTLQVCDYLGESLASFFGITTPKYQYEIDAYHRQIREEENEKKKMDLEQGNWSNSDRNSVILASPQCSSIDNDNQPRF